MILNRRNLLKFLLEIDTMQSIKNEIAIACLIGPSQLQQKNKDKK